MDPARAHALAMGALGSVEHLGLVRSLVASGFVHHDPRLVVRKMGLVFPSPVGLAGGFDKNAERARALAALGFGFLELGTVTAEAQAANPSPNLFRLPADRALVNRLGFPNLGADHVAARLAEARASGAIRVPVGMSIGKSRSVPLDPPSGVLEDYRKSTRAVRSVSDFLVVNISSPNTKDLRALQAAEVARGLFEAVRAEAGEAMPVLVKIAPDLPDASIDAICDEAMRAGLAGIVATNTTIAREGLATAKDVVFAMGAGGLSGPPLHARALDVVRRVRARVGEGPCVIGVGGIDTTDKLVAMLQAGADLVQLYTAFVYEGPGLPKRLARELGARLDAAGASDLSALR
jgi:dihydroorotate dehydrogenase